MEYNGKGSLTELVDSALESANGSSPDPWFKFPYWKRQLENGIRYADSDSVIESQYTALPEAPVLFDEEYRKESHSAASFNGELCAASDRTQAAQFSVPRRRARLSFVQ